MSRSEKPYHVVVARAALVMTELGSAHSITPFATSPSTPRTTTTTPNRRRHANFRKNPYAARALQLRYHVADQTAVTGKTITLEVEVRPHARIAYKTTPLTR
jgi:hypothetical protein